MIPRIGVRSRIETTALKSAWDFEAPHSWSNTAWFNRGVRPGARGRSLIFGHLDSTCCPAVFWRLNQLRPGDIVKVAYRTGATLTFRVRWSQVYWYNHALVKWVFRRARDRSLMLVTCAGIFYSGSGYDRRLLVDATLVLPSHRRHRA